MFYTLTLPFLTFQTFHFKRYIFFYINQFTLYKCDEWAQCTRHVLDALSKCNAIMGGEVK